MTGRGLGGHTTGGSSSMVLVSRPDGSFQVCVVLCVYAWALRSLRKKEEKQTSVSRAPVYAGG